MDSDWLRELSSLWKTRITEAKEAKEKSFSKEADSLWSFLVKDYRELYFLTDDTVAFNRDEGPYFKPRINKFREFVDLYTPFVLAQLPYRRVSSTRPVFPEEIYNTITMPFGVPFSQIDKASRTAIDTAAIILEWLLNYGAREYRLLREARMAATEAFVKGRGLLWHGLLSTSSGVMPAALYESVDNLFIDPSSVTLRDAGYIIRRRLEPAWLISEKLGINQQKLVDMSKRIENDPRSTSEVDMVEYYEVYSRIGSGARLAQSRDPLKDVQESLDSAGEYMWFIIMEGADYPLNLDPDVILGDATMARQAVQWPVATYGDIVDPWPCSILDFFPNVTDPWATSPLRSGLPFQVFLDHLYGYVVSQARRSTRQVVVVPDHIDKGLISAIEGEQDFCVVPVSVQQTSDLAKELYHVITFPGVPEHIWQLISMVEERFDRAVGLDPVLYGAQPTRQIRSASEAKMRYQAATGRAQFMAERVEDWMGVIATKDGLLTRLHVPFTQIARYFDEPVVAGEDGNPVPGGPLSMLWGQAISTPDPLAASQDFMFDIVAGTAQRKDKEQQQSAAMTIAQTLMPVALEAAAKTGDYGMFNRVLERLSNAYELDLGMFRMEQTNVMPQQQPEGGMPNGQEIARQMDSKRNQAAGRTNRQSQERRNVGS